MVLAMTHEEVVADLVRREVQSYKHLPRLIYHIQTKFRDEPRPRAGLIRVREFTMKDSYSLDADWDGLDKQYRAHYQAYFNIYHRCGLDVIAVKSDTGMMGGKLAHEFMYLNPDRRRYAHPVRRLRLQRQPPGGALPEDTRRPGRIETDREGAHPGLQVHRGSGELPGRAEIQNRQGGLLHGDQSREGRRTSTEKFIFAVIRGDLELNETKLANAVGARDLRPATEEEIKAVGAVPGFASPIGLIPAPIRRRGARGDGGHR